MDQGLVAVADVDDDDDGGDGDGGVECTKFDIAPSNK